LGQDGQYDDLGGYWTHAEEHGEGVPTEQRAVDRVVCDRETKRHCPNRIEYGFEFREERIAVLDSIVAVSCGLDFRQRARAQAQRVSSSAAAELRPGVSPRNRRLRILVVFVQALVEQRARLGRQGQLDASGCVINDAVPKLLDERETRLHIELEQLLNVARRHVRTVALQATFAANSSCARDPDRPIRRCTHKLLNEDGKSSRV
jgi:hypothetical protein